MKKLKYIFGIFLALLMSSCTEEEALEANFEGLIKVTMYDYIKDDDKFSGFLEILEKGGIDKTLSAFNPHGNGYTLFLPDNNALDKFIDQSQQFSSLDDLLNDEEYVRAFGRYHIINMIAQTNDFPFGAFPQPTLTFDFLTVSFITETDSSYYKINNQASVIRPNIEVANGYIHLIDVALTPVTMTTYQWLEQNSGFSIFKEAVDLTGLQHLIDFNLREETNRQAVTALLEHDTIYNKQGIYSIDDLKQKISPDNTDYTNPSNPLYNFVGYHFLPGRFFIDNFSDVATNYNTFGEVPVNINGLGLDIMINRGREVFDTIILPGDTTIIDFILFNYDASNVVTQSGSIHFIDRVLQQQRPTRSIQNFQFNEEPHLNAFKQEGGGTLLIESPELLNRIDWSGTDLYFMFHGSVGEHPAWQNDYLFLDGDFTITYTIPRIVQGAYDVQIRADAFDPSNAIVEVYIDGNKIGGIVDLTTGGNANNPFQFLDLGPVEFTSYSEHTVEVRSIVPGRFLWDVVRFLPR